MLFNGPLTAKKTLFFKLQEAVDRVKEVTTVTRSDRSSHPSSIHSTQMEEDEGKHI
jgi:hypothetical protein